ncbi:MAG: DNA polymerase III subunit beta [Pseudomonadales bacterium]|nr:DNA polymerase III subunit beta [Pseudomonadales bacterium]
MKFTVSRDALIKPLQQAAGVVERRHTLPVLANVLLVLENDQLSLTGTDLEVEMIGIVAVDPGSVAGEITVPARKLMDICKSLPENAQLQFSLEDDKATIKAGRSRFTLATLPARDFPNTEDEPGTFELGIDGKQLKRLLDSCSFAMAQQDVRYYLNGMLFEVTDQHLRVVATDGHRLAMQTLSLENAISQDLQLIFPRKAVTELSRLLTDVDGEVTLVFGSNLVRARMRDFVFTSKLVEGKFPDYNRVLPKGSDKTVTADRLILKQAFNRASILSNEKYRGVKILLSTDEMQILANNPEQEEAEEIISASYQGEPLEIGFNVSYLLDVLNVLDCEQVKISLADSNSSALLEGVSDDDAVYVVMPMRL